MEVGGFRIKFVLIYAIIHLVCAKNHYRIQQDSVLVTNDVSYGLARCYIVNNNLNTVVNLTKQMPTNANMIVKAWHRNPRGKYDMIGIPWTVNGCQYIETDRIIYENLRKLKNTQLPETCPIQPALYYFKDFDVNQINIPIVIPMGRYKIEVRGVTGKMEIVKVIWHGQLIPQ